MRLFLKGFSSLRFEAQVVSLNPHIVRDNETPSISVSTQEVQPDLRQQILLQQYINGMLNEHAQQSADHGALGVLPYARVPAISQD